MTSQNDLSNQHSTKEEKSSPQKSKSQLEETNCSSTETELRQSNNSKNLRILPQVLLTSVCCLAHLGIGASLNFSGITLLQLREDLTREDEFNQSFNDTTLSNTTPPYIYYEVIRDIGENMKPELQIKEEYLKLSKESFQNESLYNEKLPTNQTQTFWVNSFYNLKLTQTETALFGSGVTFGAACCAPITGMILIWLGHKRTGQLGLLIAFTVWTTIIITPYIPLLLLARLCQGIAVSVLVSSTDMWVLETSHQSIRGVSMASLSFCRYFGTVFIFSIGATEILWRYQALICCVVTTVPTFFAILFFPTSPRYLSVQGDKEGAKKALIFFRGPKYDITEEIKQLDTVLTTNDQNQNMFKRQLCYLFLPRVRKYFFLCLIIAACTQINGQGVVLVYAGPILQESLPEVNPYFWSIVFATLRVLGSFIFGGLSLKFSRRIIFFTFDLISATSLIVFGLHLYLKDYHNELFPWWVPIISLSILMISTAILSPLGFLLVGEILPTNCRSLGYALMDMIAFLFYFIITFTFPFLEKSISPYGAFWLYASCSLVIVWIPFLCLPETQGKNLEEIQIKLFSPSTNKIDEICEEHGANKV